MASAALSGQIVPQVRDEHREEAGTFSALRTPRAMRPWLALGLLCGAACTPAAVAPGRPAEVHTPGALASAAYDEEGTLPPRSMYTL